MAKRDREHIVVTSDPEPEPFTAVRGGGGDAERPAFSGDRVAHGQRLAREMTDALEQGEGEAGRMGRTIAFESFSGIELALTSLDSRRHGPQPELLSVTERDTEGGRVQIATVYIPDKKKEYFLKLIEAYVQSLDADKVKHARLVEAISSIRRATVRDLWTDPPELFPDDDAEPKWWEVWLRQGDGEELQRFDAFAERGGLKVSRHCLGFRERTVLLAKATVQQLGLTSPTLDDIAELRRPHELADFLPRLPAAEQAQWANELRERSHAAGPDAPCVAILDTGVQDTHVLLTHSLAERDTHVVDPTWTKAPTCGHGTEMAGLALYGSLEDAIDSDMPVELHHRLESVKILPDHGENDADLYGAIVSRSVDRVEIQAADRRRVFMLAVTAPIPAQPVSPEAKRSLGQPTSWSAAIDALAYGDAIDDQSPQLSYLDRDQPPRPRLFVISTGNVTDLVPGENHLDRCDTEPVDDPAQAWNAIAVGAYSEIDDMVGADPSFAGFVPVAPRGELAPSSRTSVLFDRKKWPVKPDVVADGGNYAVSPDKTSVDSPPNLQLLTTSLQRGPSVGAFTTTKDTSAATAQVAAIAGEIRAAYPGFRSETVRGLIVHSAEWTKAMLDRFDGAHTQFDRVTLLRRYGMGVPDLTRAIRSAENALTLVAEAQIHPYEREGAASDGKLREMNLHQLPWPTTVLESLGEKSVRLRVTLSYFIEPNPSRRAWNDRYVYESHALRFDVRRADESIQHFRERKNERARPKGYISSTTRPERGWMFGSSQRDAPGSVPSDIWEGTAVELASKSAIAVYPVTGWWKHSAKLDRSEDGVWYSLIVSIEAPEVEVDLWTPVAQQVRTAIEVER